jgi:hypothetical protein
MIGALSHALDMTEGQPKGHCVRCVYIDMAVAQDLELDARQQWELYYTLLLKDLGCSSNAARICELYLTNDLEFKRDFKLVGSSLPQVVRFVLTHTGLKSGLAERFRATLDIFQHGVRLPSIWCKPAASAAPTSLARCVLAKLSPKACMRWMSIGMVTASPSIWPVKPCRCMPALLYWPR